MCLSPRLGLRLPHFKRAKPSRTQACCAVVQMPAVAMLFVHTALFPVHLLAFLPRHPATLQPCNQTAPGHNTATHAHWPCCVPPRSATSTWRVLVWLPLPCRRVSAPSFDRRRLSRHPSIPSLLSHHRVLQARPGTLFTALPVCRVCLVPPSHTSSVHIPHSTCHCRAVYSM
eukprot:TRINITY_DN7356_c0_g2_i3.p2 TRINITY_DN7356_c0_g2~~TRINITY_DN7356_c0_g2_i3.p2  ORF type:complete len:172 (+),score=0.22 TRINITY_DN7356_c0_g2_i3:506-1021(+)